MEDTISINHNWFNACNLIYVWRLLSDDYKETRASIVDIQSIADDFEGLCQRNLAANSGMNFIDFFIFILRMTEVFVSLITNHSILWSLDGKNMAIRRKALVTLIPSIPSRHQHLLFNLMSIRNIAKEMSVASFFKQCEVCNQEFTGEEMLYSQNNILDDSSKNMEATGAEDILNGVVQLSAEGLSKTALEREGIGLDLFPGCTFQGLELEAASRVDFGQTSNCGISAMYLFHSIDGKIARIRIETPNALVHFIQKILDCVAKQ